MSKANSKPKPRKTRLKGTDTKKPCRVVKRDGTVLGCLKTKDRFKDFKPRWAGCDTHRTEAGRRYYSKGCAACDAKVNGNIRQPYCIECDKARPKKRAAKKAAATPSPTPVAAAETEAERVERYAESAEQALSAVSDQVLTAEPEAVEPQTLGTLGAGADSDDPAEAAQNEADNAEPITVEAKAEPSPESVKLPEPESEPESDADEPSFQSVLDMFGGGSDSE